MIDTIKKGDNEKGDNELTVPSGPWQEFFEKETAKEYFPRLARFVAAQYAAGAVFPKCGEVFSAFEAVSPEQVKAVILGQDPYHRPNQAHGLAFSVKHGEKKPPSLRNIYREIETDTGAKMPETGCLLPWTKQGVLLLNTVLTVREGEPCSHRNKGWESLTDSVVEYLNRGENPKVFLLWGKEARAKRRLIDNPAHLVLEAAHPSPLSANNGFFGCRHFTKTNEFLKENGIKPVDWVL